MNQIRNAKGQTEDEFLKAYDPNKYPCPAVSVDILVFSQHLSGLRLLLIKRKNHPFIKQWAFPGGFLDINEDLVDAAYRENFMKKHPFPETKFPSINFILMEMYIVILECVLFLSLILPC